MATQVREFESMGRLLMYVWCACVRVGPLRCPVVRSNSDLLPLLSTFQFAEIDLLPLVLPPVAKPASVVGTPDPDHHMRRRLSGMSGLVSSPSFVRLTDGALMTDGGVGDDAKSRVSMRSVSFALPTQVGRCSLPPSLLP